MSLNAFSDSARAWFESTFAEPTAAQTKGWRAIGRGEHALICAPTGSGKTLAAFLAAIDELVRDGLAGRLTDETRVVYVSPLLPPTQPVAPAPSSWRSTSSTRPCRT